MIFVINRLTMFLSKKNAIYFNKPKHIDPNKPKRILPSTLQTIKDWQKDEDEKNIQYDFAPTKYEAKVPVSNLLADDDFTDLSSDVPKMQNSHKFYFNWDELDQKNDIECEKRVVQEIVQPGGIRIKPNETMLNQFLKEVKGMEVHIIGSLLLSKLEVNYPFQTKAKALYTIQFLAKKHDVYQSYFKANAQKIREFPEPEDNVENYKKILKSVLNGLGISSSNQAINMPEESKPKFVDPGYNDDPQTMMSTFIGANSNKTKKVDNKRVIIGPGQAKSKHPVIEKKVDNVNNDFMGLDLLGSSSQPQNVPQQSNEPSNLLESGSGQAGQLSFEDMMGGINLGGNSNPQKPQSNSNFLI